MKTWLHQSDHHFISASRYTFCSMGLDFSSAYCHCISLMPHTWKGDMYPLEADQLITTRVFSLSYSENSLPEEAGAAEASPWLPVNAESLLHISMYRSHEGKIDKDCTTSGKFHSRSWKPMGEWWRSQTQMCCPPQ